MRQPTRQLVITFLLSLGVGYGISWALMVMMKAEFRFFGFGTLTVMALLWATLMVFILDGPLNLKAFDWPAPADENTVRQDNLRHFLIVSVLIVVIGGALAGWLNNADLLPTAASAQSESIDHLLGLHFGLIGILFALVSVFMIYSIIVFRRKSGDIEEGAYFHGHTTLEIVWTVAPLLIVVYFGYLGVRSLNDVTAPQSNEIIVEVEARQWAWNFTYPEYGNLKSAELNLPVGRPVLLKMNSIDTLHSFWVPEFRVKQDVVPGRETVLRITPTLVGEYKLRCAEICGLAHATMLAGVNVMEPDEFLAWAGEEVAPAAELTPAERGAKVAQSQACQGCHSVNGSALVGPTWLGLFGKQETLEDGSTVTVDEAYLRKSILDPNAQIVAGFPQAMPPIYADLLSDEEIDDLVAYIKSLGQ